MSRNARWIRLGPVEPLELHATVAGLAAAQPADGAPIVLWARARTPLCLGHGPGLGQPAHADASAARRPNGGALVWVEAGEYVFVLIASRRDAPGRSVRWLEWALAPAVATYRQFGLPAYLNGNEIFLNGRKISGAGVATIGTSVAVASSFLPRFPPERFADGGMRPSAAFRSWLREGLSLAVTEWAAHDAPPAERALEDAFRARLEAQYAWCFEHAWPGEAEIAAICEARNALGGLPEDAQPRLVAQTDR